ncbi:iron-containing alcohol dehydrogenase [Anaerocolumna xylanovorans]|uniref:Alcohol dehydrogenase n=1 Tax=Anaerocolumna xylanovorans DSM 12503 TaxID=1121345 RepID=A0A1M7Y0V1_9FIRM|nr:iron-containing alcohol dehydrogenase [Anaerocolumna xylanovorans]SHO45331.1 alcohol dehydrogenase [Anaerocolumna xylanovorans DSM 12503]
MSFNMYVPTKILFGAGQLNTLHLQEMPGKKAMIVISNGKSTRVNGYLSRTEEQLKSAGVECVVFDKVQPNPLKVTVMDGAGFAKENGCDFIVALGGGSVIDSAKAIAVMAANTGDLWDYIGSGTGKGQPIQNRPLPIIAISTTAGTGSEADAGCVVTNPETNEKVGLKTPLIFPVLCIEDPELMTSVPAGFTAYQGFDALSHSLEGYVSKYANLMSDMYALTAIENVGRHLARAVKNGNDMEAREHIAFGNILSGTVMCVGTTSSQHSLEHALSAYHENLPHGAGLIMLSRSYFGNIIEHHACDDRFVRMARAMGMEDATRPEDFLTVLQKLLEDCGVADLKMSDYGITPDEFSKMADNAMGPMGGLFACDRVSLTKDDVIAIYQKSYK